jgi:hypothetical protein
MTNSLLLQRRKQENLVQFQYLFFYICTTENDNAFKMHSDKTLCTCASMLSHVILFLFFFLARVCWPLLCLFRPFCIFERDVWIRTQRAAAASNLATHFPFYLRNKKKSPADMYADIFRSESARKSAVSSVQSAARAAAFTLYEWEKFRPDG